MDMKKFESLADVLTFAIAQEQVSYEFYGELSKRAETEVMKKIFLGFAEQEKLHKERLQRVLGVTEPVILDPSHRDAIAKYVSAVPDADDMTYEIAIKTAVNKEHAAMMLYQILAKLTPQKELREILELLAVEELHHKKLLEKEYHDILIKRN
jgi:rubrerythrin